jgi:predicted nuclease of predicted toxin-antitoxin system
VAESVCKLLEARGHDVTRSRAVIPPDSPDPIVAKAAQDADAILISEDGDFKSLVQRKGRRFKRLSRVSLRCGSAQTANRMAAALSLVEFEFAQAQIRQDKRIIIEIHVSLIRILR